MNNWRILLSFLLTVALTGCGYNTMQAQDEQIKASWSEVVNQYQRRADLIPNLVNTVKAYAAHEKDVLTQVADARSRVGSLQVTPALLNDPQAFEKFQRAQGELSGALSRLMAVSENYPQLKADANFRDLQAQLEGTENRIAVARGDFNTAVQGYDTTIKSFPAVLYAGMFGFKEKPYFSAAAGAETAPKVEFNFGNAPATNKP